MKKIYLTPLAEAMELSTEQNVLTVSNGILTIAAIGSSSANGSGLEGMEGWGSTESWTE